MYWYIVTQFTLRKAQYPLKETQFLSVVKGRFQSLLGNNKHKVLKDVYLHIFNKLFTCRLIQMCEQFLPCNLSPKVRPFPQPRQASVDKFLLLLTFFFFIIIFTGNFYV